MKKLMFIMVAFMLFGLVAKAEFSKVNKPIEWKSNATISVSPDKSVLQADGVNFDYLQQLQQSSNKLLVTGLNDNVTKDELFKLFGQWGKLSEASVIYDNRGRSRNFGYVTFIRKVDAERAIKYLNKTMFKGKIIEVSFDKGDPVRLP
jgi:RNA recognition motif-containing protein